ncbi:sugar transport protein stp1 [Fusarium langsethiae]|uniref:Sugar transport protein stp1 n=1 Tax=Fusarium langsethiae TaxID=179993 RepID=A0A0M9F577_FUSLA|nr:sugar transport protein stp1 [Fusarium langsethiae]GKT98012.1 unnamed protein product [Fusarium langsethiae]GKU11109.1 unnamed protein product [Fusarium langsethiae]
MSTPSFLENDSLEGWEGWDESLGLILPDTDPVMDQPSPDPPAPEAPASEELTIPELKAEIDQKVRLAAETAREARWSHFYDHIPRTELDWTLEGRYVCRAVHLRCYGSDLRDGFNYGIHLRTAAHLRHEAELAAEWVEPSPSPTQPPTPEAPASEMEQQVEVPIEEGAIDPAHSSTGYGDGEALTKPTKRPRLPLDAVIPDSEEDDPLPAPKRAR